MPNGNLTMECPHISVNVKIDSKVVIKDSSKDWQCAECLSTVSPWICLYCGVVLCGRYVNGHAKRHSESQVNHVVCMDCENLSVFCYSCDEFVENDTNNSHISRLRAEFHYNGKRSKTPSENTDQEGSDSAQNWSSSSSNSEQSGRRLRPRSRKRSSSFESSSSLTENGDCKSTRSRNGDEKRLKRTSISSEDTPSKAKIAKKVVGLRNLGNTCFMNAVLQSLSNISQFTLYFKRLPSLDTSKLNSPSPTGRNRLYQSRSIKELSDAVMAEELRKVLINLTDHGTKGAISPESLFLVIWKVVPRFRGYQQQDAHEFLRYMLDRLHTELLHLLPNSTFKDSSYFSLGQKSRSSIVTTVFGGMLQSEVRCLNCSVESKKHDPFLDLSLDIPDVKCQQTNNKKSKVESTPLFTILDCLTSFIQVEELAETELYYCNNCKSKQRSTKRFWIRRLPNVLCLHLKRFRWNNFFRTKIDTSIAFPVTALDMSQFVLSDLRDTRLSGTGTNLYDLAAVIVHHGSGAGSGHYTAFAVNEGQWFHFDDSSVRISTMKAVEKCKPYILFYIRREFRLPSVQS